MNNITDAKSKLLLISRYFPPDGQVGGRRLHRFCQYLPPYGIKPFVITYPKVSNPRESEPSGLEIVRVNPWPNPMQVYDKTKRRISGVRQGGSENQEGGSSISDEGDRVRLFQRLKDDLGTLLQVPDKSNGWFFPAVSAAKKLIRENEIGTILTSGPPWTCHLVGRKLKEQLGVKWLADFRDPWTAEVMRTALPTWRQNLGKKLESSCVHLADQIICTTEQIQEFFFRSYPLLPKQKFIVIPNGFEPIRRPDSVAQDSRRLLLHIGNLYGTRRIDTFAQAIKSMVANGEIDPLKTRIVFLGDSENSLVEAARAVAPELFEKRILEFSPKVAWQEAQRVLWGADLHLIFQGKHTMQIPAKFFECLQTGAPILAVAEPGALTEIVNKTDSGVCADSRNPDEIVQKLRTVLHCERATTQEVASKFVQFQWSAVTGKLAELVSDLPTSSISSDLAPGTNVQAPAVILNIGARSQPLRVYLTIDVECSMGDAWLHPELKPVPVERGILGRSGNSYYGIPLFMDMLEEHGIKGVFFIEVLSAFNVQKSELAEAYQSIIRRGHDVQLHIHPTQYYYHLFKQGLIRESELSITHDLIGFHPYDEQVKLLTIASDLFRELTNRDPVAFRAGNYAANLTTLIALQDVGIFLDSSYNAAFVGKGCMLPGGSTNRAFRVGSVQEIPVTVFQTGSWPKRGLKPLELSSISFEEVAGVLDQALRSGMHNVTAILHSFSLFKTTDRQYSHIRPDRIVIRRIEKLCKYLASRCDDLQVQVLSSCESVQDQNQAALPDMGVMRPVIRKAVQLVNRAYWI